MKSTVNLIHFSLLFLSTSYLSSTKCSVIVTAEVTVAAFSPSFRYSSPLLHPSHYRSSLYHSLADKQHQQLQQRRQQRLPFLYDLKLYQTKENDVNDDDISPETTLTSTISFIESIDLHVPSHDDAKYFFGDILGCSLSPEEGKNDNDNIIRMYCGSSSESKLSYFRLTQPNDSNSSIKGSTASKSTASTSNPSSMTVGLHFESLEGLKQCLEDQKIQQGDNDCIVKNYEIGIDERTQQEYVRLVHEHTNTIFYARTQKKDSSAGGGGATSTCLGISYIEFTVRPNIASMISQFYDGIFDVPTTIVQNENAEDIVIIGCGDIDVETGQCSQSLLFRECKQQAPPSSSLQEKTMSISLCCDGYDDEEIDYRRVLNHCEMANIASLPQNNARRGGGPSFCFDNILDLRTGRTVLKLKHEILSV
uniref:VOC domain-containing protein n=1 Tax=Ditylum brightwellii TaxID=49249 RepID=A0A7S4TAT2_9STRA